jgi:hypothetical protein
MEITLRNAALVILVVMVATIAIRTLLEIMIGEITPEVFYELVLTWLLVWGIYFLFGLLGLIDRG